VLVFGLKEVTLNFMDFLPCFVDLGGEPWCTKDLLRPLIYLLLVFLHHLSDKEFFITNLTDITPVPSFWFWEHSRFKPAFGAKCQGTELAILYVLIRRMLILAAIAITVMSCVWRFISLTQLKYRIFLGKLEELLFDGVVILRMVSYLDDECHWLVYHLIKDGCPCVGFRLLLVIVERVVKPVLLILANAVFE
jgi:hypothetical protein